MLILQIYLNTALDIAKSRAPSKENIEFDNIKQIERAFRFFPKLTVTDSEVLKDGVPVGKILEGSVEEN